MRAKLNRIDAMFMRGQLNAKKVTKSVFGGTDRSQMRNQREQNSQAKELIAEKAAEARRDALAIAPAAEDNRNMGFQAAIDALAKATPSQSRSLQAGSRGAQETLLAGLPQMQNAILGRNVSFAGLQPRTAEPDLRFLNQQLPEFIGIDQALGGQQLKPDLTEEQILQLTQMGVLLGGQK